MEPIDDRLDDVEHRLLRPVHVIEDHDERSVRGQDLEQAADGPRCIGRQRFMNTENLSESIRYRRSVRFVDQPSSKHRCDSLSVRAGEVGGGCEKLDQRRERDPLPIGGRLCDEDAGGPTNRVGERLTQPGLAHTGRSEDHDEDTHSAFDRVIQRVLEHAHGARPADERCLRERRRLANAEDAEHVDRFGLALQPPWLHRLGSQVPPREALGRGGDEDIADLRRRLEPRRGVERITGNPALDRGAIVRERLPGIDGDADLDPRVDATDLAVEFVGGPSHLQRRANGTEGVIFVRRRDPECTDHRVADELLDRAAMPFDRGAHRSEVAVQDASEDLGIRSLSEVRRADEVAEQRSHDAPTWGAFVCRQSLAAGVAESRRVRIRGAARLTRLHGGSVEHLASRRNPRRAVPEYR